MPAELDKIRKAVQRENPGMPQSRTWAIATSTFKKKHGIKGKTTEGEMHRKADYIRDKEGAFRQGFFEECAKIGGWIHNRAKRIMKDSPGTRESTAFAVATQQAYATGKEPKKQTRTAGKWGTEAGEEKAEAKYPHKAEYQKTAFLEGFLAEIQKIAAETERLKGQPFRVAMKNRDSRDQASVSEGIESKSLQTAEMHNREANMPY